MATYIDCAKCTDEDFEGGGIPAEGLASWKITEVEAGESKQGKPKLKITFQVVDSTGARRLLFEHLPMSVEWRVAKIATATGTQDQAKEGRIDIDSWIGKTGKGMIKHEASPGYSDKPVWNYFIDKDAPDPVEAPRYSGQEPPPIEAEFNDDVPF